MMIKTVDEFDSFAMSPKFQDSHFNALSNENVAFFRHCLEFDENGNVIKIYFGDFSKAGLDDEKISEVANLFGIDKDRFFRTYHAFGDGQGNCVRRDYWWCPY